MDSFYGGKQGISFVIRAKFPSINEMLENFANSNYKDVWYGQYCIIDTLNKNNPDNGKVYRRTLNNLQNPNSELNGLAEYIGQLVGPSSGIPIIKFGNIQSTEDKFDDLAGESGFSDNNIIYYQDATSTPTPGMWRTEYPENQSVTNLYIQSSTTDDESEKVIFKSGREYGLTPTEAPNLKYNYYILQTYNGQNTPLNAEMQMGLEIPYIDVDFNEIETLSPLEEATVVETTDSRQNTLNQFYRTYKLGLPSGFPGATVRNIREMNFPDDFQQDEYPILWSSIDFSVYPPVVNTNPQRWNGYYNISDDVPDQGSVQYKGKIWVYDLVSYERQVDSLVENIIENIFISTEIQPTHIGIYPDVYIYEYQGTGTEGSPYIPGKQQFKELLTTAGISNPKEASLVTVVYTVDNEKFTKYGMVHYTGNSWDVEIVGTLQPLAGITSGLFDTQNNEYFIPEIEEENLNYVRFNVKDFSDGYVPVSPWR